jgi:hypothetical protein
MLKNFITVFGLILLLAFGYYLFVLEDQGLRGGNQAVSTQAAAETQEFLRRLNQLQSVELQTEIFTDPRFTNRIDYSAPVPVLPVGRENPFLPVNE